MRSYLDLDNNAYIADANIHYTECGIAKFITGILYMESLITKRFMNIQH